MGISTKHFSCTVHRVANGSATLHHKFELCFTHCLCCFTHCLCCFSHCLWCMRRQSRCEALRPWDWLSAGESDRGISNGEEAVFQSTSYKQLICLQPALLYSCFQHGLLSQWWQQWVNGWLTFRHFSTIKAWSTSVGKMVMGEGYLLLIK